jgi:hypothetical protein
MSTPAWQIASFARLGMRWQRVGEYERAVVMYERVLDGVVDAAILQNLSVCQIRLKHYRRALARLDQLEAVLRRKRGRRSDEPMLWWGLRYNRALAQSYLGQDAAALEGARRLALEVLASPSAPKWSPITRRHRARLRWDAAAQAEGPAVMLYTGLEYGAQRDDATNPEERAALALEVAERHIVPDGPVDAGLAETLRGRTRSAIESGAPERLEVATAYVRAVHGDDRRARYNLACFWDDVTADLRAVDDKHAADVADLIVSRAAEDLDAALDDPALGRWAADDPSLDHVRNDERPEAADVIERHVPKDATSAEPRRPTFEEPAAPESGRTIADALTLAGPGSSIQDEATPAKPRGLAAEDRAEDALAKTEFGAALVVGLRPLREGGGDAFLAEGTMTTGTPVRERAELAGFIDDEHVTSTQTLLDGALARIFEIDGHPAMLVVRPTGVNLALSLDAARSGRNVLEALFRHFFTLLRRTDEDERTGRLRRSSGYRRQAVRLDVRRSGEPPQPLATVGMYEPPDFVATRVHEELARLAA